MTARHSSNRRLPVVALLSAPAVAVLAVLAAMGKLDRESALLAAMITVGLISLLFRIVSSDLAETTRFVRQIGRGGEPPLPRLRTELTADLQMALTQVFRGVRSHSDEMAGLVAFHQTLFDSLPSPMFLLNRQRRVVRANKAARGIFGRQMQDRDLAAVLRNPPLLDAVEEVLSGAPGREVELTLTGASDREFRAMVEPLPRSGVDGTVAVLSLHDVTALRRMEQMRADFVANASHELRTPLSALLGFIETLRGPARDDSEARERFLAIMYEQASRMSRLVADLLNLSRIELNEHTDPVGCTDIGVVVRRIAQGLELEAEQRSMQIVLALAEDLPPVTGQEDELAQIFQNLLENALKYGREGTQIEVTAAVADRLPASMAGRFGCVVAVAVRDRGEGIAREHIPRLTERFFRVDTARSRRLGGTGLGLAIVKHLVNRHRGGLSIDSVLGEGSTFTVYLPGQAGWPQAG